MSEEREKPRLNVPIPDDLKRELEEYIRKKNIPTITDAVLDFIKRGMRDSNGGSNSDAHDEETIALKAMQKLDDGESPIDIMVELSLSPSEMKKILKEYSEINSLMRHTSGDNEMFFELVKRYGEDVRESCDYYDSESGVCTLWKVDEIDPKVRSNNPTWFKTVGKKLRLNVSRHPEFCAICQKRRF